MRPTFYSDYVEEEDEDDDDDDDAAAADDDDDDDDDDDGRIPSRSDQAFKKMDFVPNQVMTSLGVLAIQLSKGNLNMMVVSSWLKQPIFHCLL